MVTIYDFETLKDALFLCKETFKRVRAQAKYNLLDFEQTLGPRGKGIKSQIIFAHAELVGTLSLVQYRLAQLGRVEEAKKMEEAVYLAKKMNPFLLGSLNAFINNFDSTFNPSTY